MLCHDSSPAYLKFCVFLILLLEFTKFTHVEFVFLLESCSSDATDPCHIKHVQFRKFFHLEVLRSEEFECATNFFSFQFYAGKGVSCGVNLSPKHDSSAYLYEGHRSPSLVEITTADT